MTALEAFELIKNTPLEFWEKVTTCNDTEDQLLRIWFSKKDFHLYIHLRGKELFISFSVPGFNRVVFEDNIFGNNIILFENFFETARKYSCNKTEEIFKSLLTPTNNEEDNF